MMITRSNTVFGFRSFLFCMIAMGLSGVPSVSSQTRQDGRRLADEAIFGLKLDGTLSRFKLIHFTTDPEQDLLITVLENEVTRRDLGLDDEKWNLLKRDFDASKSLLEKYSLIVRQRIPTAAENEDFKQGMENHLSAIRDRLTEEQWYRVGQLGVRYYMRKMGPTVSIFSGELGKKLDMPIGIRSEFFTVGTGMEEPLRRLSMDLKTKAMERLLSRLTPRHRTELEEYFKRNNFQPENINFGVFMWQLDYQPESQKKNEGMSEASTPRTNTEHHKGFAEEFFELQATGTFNLTISGGLEPRKRPAINLDAVVKKGLMDSQVIRLLMSPNIAKPLELSDGQIAMFREAFDIFHEQNNELIAEFQDAPDRQKALPKIKAARIESYKVLDGLVERVLFPHQIEWLQEYVGRIGATRIGLVGSLVDGQLGRTLGITESEKKALLEEAAKIRDELMPKSLELENEIYDRLMASLPEEDAQRLNEMIGKPIEEGYANLDVLADQLAGIGYVND